MMKAFFPIASPKWTPVIDQLANLLHCFAGIARVALQPKVHMVETDSLFPVQSWYGETSPGSAEWGMMFLIRVACQRAYGHAVCPIVDLMDSSRAILMVTKV